MKPYSRRGLKQEERIFNYHISGAKRVVENLFGLLVQVWRCLLKTMEVNTSKASKGLCVYTKVWLTGFGGMATLCQEHGAEASHCLVIDTYEEGTMDHKMRS